MIAIQMMIARAMDSLRTLRDEESGQGMVEYGLILALVAVVAAAGFAILGEDIKTFIETTAGEL